ncbi:MFS transporter [Clostridium felsineum]|uniref:MFS transporter n=1 Tax=Clostridium felsineum TaxID=36839 RepID=UPI00098C906B|nr:MFS transporter [Clostridium felsineum]URZ17265.1 Isoprimeverose transporter [Clostridium felsineum DSM 794]
MKTVAVDKAFDGKVKIPFSEKLAVGGGAFAANLVLQAVGMYLMFFYTDIFKISAIAAGTLFLVARIVDAVVDFTMGYVIDRTKTKWGKFRPWVMLGFIPFCVLGVLCFTVPGFTGTAKVVYAYVTYILFMITTTLTTLPSTAIQPAMTQEPMERVKINNYSQFLGMAGMMIVAVGMMPIVSKLGGKNQAKGFFFTMIIFGIIAAVLFLFWILKVRERIVVEKQEELKLKEAIPSLIRNKYLLLLVGTFVFFMSGFTIRNNVQMYYLIYDVKRPDLIPTIGLLSMLPLVLTILIVPAVIGKLGKKNTLILGMIIVAVTNTCQYFVGFSNITMIYIVTFISAIGSGLFLPSIWGMLPDTVDYAQWKFGIRTEGIISSTFIFCQKASSGIAGYIAGVALVAIGYVPNIAQSASAVKGISFLYNVAGSILSIVAVVFMLFYNLDAKKFDEIIEDLHKR